MADAYEAMTADRVYRPVARSGDRAGRAQRQASGSQFDPEVVTAFVRALDAGRARALRVA